MTLDSSAIVAIVFAEPGYMELVDRILWRAARQAFATYGRGRHKANLNVGDCLAYATATARVSHHMVSKFYRVGHVALPRGQALPSPFSASIGNFLEFLGNTGSGPTGAIRVRWHRPCL